MSHRIKINGVEVAVIREEPDSKCELCGSVEETRPYGPRGERICHPCAMKDPATTERQMNRVIWGKNPMTRPTPQPRPADRSRLRRFAFSAGVVLYMLILFVGIPVVVGWCLVAVVRSFL